MTALARPAPTLVLPLGCAALALVLVRGGAGPAFLLVAATFAAVAALVLAAKPAHAAAVLAGVLSVYPIARVEVGPVPLYASDALVGLAVAAAAWRGVQPGRFGGLVAVYVAAWLPAWLLEVLRVGLVLEPTYGFARHAVAVAAVFGGMAAARERGGARAVVAALAVGTVATSLLALAQAFGPTAEAARTLLERLAPAFSPAAYRVYPDRAFALFAAATILSGFLAMLLPLLLSAAGARSRLRPILLGTATLASLAAVVTYSRQWLPALAVGLLVAGVLRPGALGRSLLVGAAVAGSAWALAAAGVVDARYLGDRFSSFGAADANVATRVERQREFLRVVREEPLDIAVGRGFAGQDLVARGLVDSQAEEELRAGLNDNAFLLELFNHGLVAAVLYVVLLGGALARAAAVARGGGPEAALGAGLAGALAAALTLHLFDNYLSEAVFMKALLWLLAGLAVGLGRREREGVDA